MSKSRTITIHPEWKELCARLESHEAGCILHDMLNLVLFGNTASEYDDRYVQYVWDKISEDIMKDMEDKT